MSGGEQAEITALLRKWRDGNPAALEQLTPLIYDELRRIAARYMRQERPGHSLQATALVHEAYLRLAGGDAADWQSRAHFFAVCANLMRRILVDYARAKRRIKRGSGAVAVNLDRIAETGDADLDQMLLIDEALSELATIDPRKVQVVELRFFVGLTVEETSAVLQIAPNTVIRDWSLAKAWLTRRLGMQS